MTLKLTSLFFIAALPALLLAEDPSSAAQEAVPQENPELENELRYVEALVDNGFPDYATPVGEAIKKRWPEAEARLFAIEVRGLLALGKIKDAEAKIASLPDRKSTKYWAARLEMANSLFQRGQKDECSKIYDEFFEVFKKPPKDIVKFYNDANWMYGQLLLRDNKRDKAVARYQYSLNNLKGDEWCSLACDTADIYLALIEETKEAKKRKDYIESVTRIVDKLLFQFEKPLFFGRAVSMKAHIELLKGDPDKAVTTIEEYRQQLDDIHNQILDYDPDGKMGLLRSSPLPQCLYLRAKILWDEAKKEYASGSRDDEKVKSLLFGKKEGKSRRVDQGAFAIAQGVFLNYETSPWAPPAGEMSQEIRQFAEEKYGAKIKTRVTPEQLEKVRAAQFRNANEKYNEGQYDAAVEGYYQVLSLYPESLDSIIAIERIASIKLDQFMEEKDEAVKAEKRLDCDTIEGYLSERFAGLSDKILMTSGGDALVRMAAKEGEYRDAERSDRLFMAFCSNYTRHTGASVTTMSRASMLQKEEEYAKALEYWKLLETVYTNSPYYATALSQMSLCYGKLGDSKRELEYISKYVGAEQNKVRKLQAQLKLAQMYKDSGIDILNNCATNSAVENVEAEERKGTALAIRAVQNFMRFEKEALEACNDPSTSAEDKKKYTESREVALFLIADCWSRMKRPEKNLTLYRTKAAENLQAYLKEYPEGQFSTNAYVKLSMIYTALGDIVKSKDALDNLSRKFPDSEAAKNAKPRLARSLIEIGMKKEGAAIYADMIGTDGKYTALQYLYAGDALIDAGNWDLANRAYEKSIRIASTNSLTTVARARLGIAKTSWRQGSLAEAREALDAFLANEKFSRMSIAADAYFMLVEVARQQGKTESDSAMRDKYFGAAAAALKKVRALWKNKPKWEQDKLTLTAGDLIIDRMKTEEAKDLKEEAKRSCEKAAAVFQIFIQSNGPTENLPLAKMDKGEVENLEIAYAKAVELFAKLGTKLEDAEERAIQAERVISFGQKYQEYFPQGKHLTEVVNYMNRAKADIPSAKADTSSASTEGE